MKAGVLGSQALQRQSCGEVLCRRLGSRSKGARRSIAVGAPQNRGIPTADRPAAGAPAQALVSQPPPLGFGSLAAAEAEAVGVELNRLQNIAVTLDKVGAGASSAAVHRPKAAFRGRASDAYCPVTPGVLARGAPGRCVLPDPRLAASSPCRPAAWLGWLRHSRDPKGGW
jgi:hypothetical protein